MRRKKVNRMRRWKKNENKSFRKDAIMKQEDKKRKIR